MYFYVGMSFGVRFKVRTFGNKHPDGWKVRIFFRISSYSIVLHVHLHVCKLSVPVKVHSYSGVTELGVVSFDVSQKRNAMQFRKFYLLSQK